MVSIFRNVVSLASPGGDVKAVEDGARAGEAQVPPLLPRVAAGDEVAMRECLTRYGGLVHAIARRYFAADSDVDDVCQDVFLAVWKNAGAYDRTRSEEATFIAMLARRRVVDRLRSPGTRALPLPEEATTAPASPPLERYVDAKTAASALNECSEAQQQVVALVLGRGLSHEEAATELGIPTGTVKSHYARAIERVKRALTSSERHQ